MQIQIQLELEIPYQISEKDDDKKKENKYNGPTVINPDDKSPFEVDFSI